VVYVCNLVSDWMNSWAFGSIGRKEKN